jgi:hypothetical protein
MMPQFTICQGCGKLIQAAPGFCFLCGEVLNPSQHVVFVGTPKADSEMEQELVAA